MLFDTEYKKLNTEQRRAVDTIEGPVMVVAGPGTGKTQILTLRIANILKKTDVNTSNILALTFTESGVVSMRRRLGEFIGSPAYSVVINTFHGFCNEIIKTYPEEFPEIIGSASINDVDQIEILTSVLGGMSLEMLKPPGDPMHYLQPILSAINDLKREGVNPKSFQKIVEREMREFVERDDTTHTGGAHRGRTKAIHQKTQKNIAKNKELAVVYAEYQKQLKEIRAYDYSDMIMEVFVRLQKNSDLLLMLQEQYQYILVDEHQDTNAAQNKIIELLANFHENPNIFVVGDEKQAIFRFQGASLENFLYFKQIYKQAELIVLEENYRSTQKILDSADYILSGGKKLRAQRQKNGQKIELYEFSSPDVENHFLATSVLQKIESGIAASEIAILYRDNKDVLSIAQIFSKVGIPFSIESGQNVLEDEDIKKLILIFKTIHNFGSDEFLAELLHVDFFSIEPLDTYKLIEAASRTRKSIYEIIAKSGELKKLQLLKPKQILDVYRKLSSWKTMSKNRSFSEFFEIVVHESGFMTYIMKKATAPEKLNLLGGLFDEVSTLSEKHANYSLEGFLSYLDILTKHNVSVRKGAAPVLDTRVRLMTAHKSKGREFEHVYIVQVYDGHWGNKRRRKLIELPTGVFSLTGGSLATETSNQDERRLFYVALTRAKKSVTLSYSKTSASEREQLPSQFVQEIQEDTLVRKDAKRYERAFQSSREMVFKPRVHKKPGAPDSKFIRDLFLSRGLSVTALNNYLTCPWKYFYTNLFRIPKLPNRTLAYGIAVHAALKDFFDAAKKRELSRELLLSRYVHHITAQSLSENDLTELKNRGAKSLGGYYDKYHETWNARVITEFAISGELLTPHIRLVGQIDKIELLDNAGSVNVVDYKTGKIKTRGQIEGSTKDSNGDIKRQLIFYRMLLGRHGGGKYKMQSADVDFIEPDAKGRYKKERFIVLDDEVSELEELIIKVSNEIMNLDFWNKGCGEAKCEFCRVRAMMGGA